MKGSVYCKLQTDDTYYGLEVHIRGLAYLTLKRVYILWRALILEEIQDPWLHSKMEHYYWEGGKLCWGLHSEFRDCTFRVCRGCRRILVFRLQRERVLLLCSKQLCWSVLFSLEPEERTDIQFLLAWIYIEVGKSRWVQLDCPSLWYRVFNLLFSLSKYLVSETKLVVWAVLKNAGASVNEVLKR